MGPAHVPQLVQERLQGLQAALSGQQLQLCGPRGGHLHASPQRLIGCMPLCVKENQRRMRQERLQLIEELHYIKQALEGAGRNQLQIQ